jgi:hypothetical protein
LGLAVFFFLRGLRGPIGVVTHGRGAARLEGERWVVCRGRAQRSAAAPAAKAGGGAGPF